MIARWSWVGVIVPRYRALMVVFYGFLCAAGAFAAFFPSRAVVDSVPYWATYVWAAFYFVGGGICAVSAALKSQLGEVLGLPLAASASALYGAAVLLSYSGRPDGAYLVVGVLLVSQALGLLDRWLAVMALLRRARE